MTKPWALFASAVIGVVILAAVAAGIATSLNNNPAQAQSGDNTTRPADTVMVEGNIESVTDKNFLLNVTSGTAGVTDKLSVTVTDRTKITGKSGETLKLSDLKAGTAVKAEVDAVMALSYPALTGAIKVAVK